MIKYIFMALLFWGGGAFLGAIDFYSIYEMIRVGIPEYGFSLLTYCTLASLTLIGLSFLMRVLNFYGLMYVFSKILLEICKIGIAFLSVLVMIIWINQQQNLWSELGVVALVPFEILTAAIICIHLFDFNIPLQRQFISIMAIPLTTLVFIIISEMFNLFGN
ncbi:MAG: hypothetical protein A2511_14115 [Deltaproteobacteria bacterium RIFOXYD12_FULL_50_9]|nr:MAG: hypothetical protein A2511_14115 [Deltaproteobacteria bacterium RIFOXYD12_FULL_50_9]